MDPSDLGEQSLVSLNVRETSRASNRFNPFKLLQARAARHGSSYGDGEEIPECIDGISIKIDSGSICEDFDVSLNDRSGCGHSLNA